jgi:aspartate/methionine/tyrosine aminotransferase
MVDEFQRRRDVIVEGLNAIEGISCVNPDGAFYVFPNVKDLGVPAREVERHLLDEAGVAALSGTAFGDHGEGYLRFSYATSIPKIHGALEAIGASFEGLRR